MSTKILLVVITLLSCTCFCMGQNVASYVVQRGDTPESIAKRYDITLEDLKKVNPTLEKMYYVGKTIYIPIIEEPSSLSVSVQDGPEDVRVSYIQNAQQLESEGEYKKAYKLYTKAIEITGASAYLYYFRGRCAAIRNKWKDAIGDYERALNSPDCTPTVERDIRSLLSQAEAQRAEQLARRSEMWLAVGGAVAMTGATVAGAYAQSKMSSNAYSGTSAASSTDYSGSSEYTGTSSSTSRSTSSASSSSGKMCRLCVGSGKCNTCNGKGTFYTSGFGVRELKDCPNCSDGTCTHCGGTGKKK